MSSPRNADPEGATMPDICDLILDDHTWFRERFSELDAMRASGAPPEQLAGVWGPLADRLEVHAVAEETLFYPRLLAVGEEALEETEDAVTDHNDITEAVKQARDLEVGTDSWWSAVGDARESNSSHTAEEERGALPDFRATASEDERLEIGAAWLAYHQEHGSTDREPLDVVDYVDEVADADRAQEMRELIDGAE